MKKRAFRPARESRTIRGEISSYSKDITRFPGNRGSRGVKVEGNWHNIVGDYNFLDQMPKNFPNGCFIKFIEWKNEKDYWDASPESMKEITKSEAYERIDQIKVQDSFSREAEEVRESFDENDEEPAPEPDYEDMKGAKREHLMVSRQDIISMYNDIQKNPVIKAINLPFYLNHKGVPPLKAVLIISLNSNEGPKITMTIDPSDKPELLHAMLIMLAHVELAKDMIMKKIEAMRHEIHIEVDASKSQDNQHT